MTDTGDAESSMLMWLLACAVAVLSLHVALGLVRRLRREKGLRSQWRPALLAAATLGTGLCGAIVLALAGEALSFPLGYRAVWAGSLWLAAIGAGLVVCAAMAFSWRTWAALLCGALFGALVLGLQIGWLGAVGFRPGITWRAEFVAAAAVLAIAVGAAGMWLALSGLSENGSRRRLWRLCASALLGLGVIAGQSVLTSGIGLPAQVGSIYAREVPGSVLGLVCGVLLPLVLGVMAIDQAMRGEERKRRHGQIAEKNDIGPPKRRKRRHRIRAL